MTKNSFKIILQKEHETVDVEYILHDTLLARKWFHKIKHIRHVPVDPVNSGLEDLSNLPAILSEFCDFAGIPNVDVDITDQKDLNTLHEIYEQNHDRLSVLKDNAILYKFHLAIHHQEDLGKTKPKNKIKIAWGTKEGPLIEAFPCYKYYAPSVKKNQLYLTEPELGKTPFQYFENGEPSSQSRINTLCKSHSNLRATCHISLKDIVPQEFNEGFTTWFKQFKEPWLAQNGLQDWTPVDEYCAPLLAHTDCKQDLTDFIFKKIMLE